MTLWPGRSPTAASNTSKRCTPNRWMLKVVIILSICIFIWYVSMGVCFLINIVFFLWCWLDGGEGSGIVYQRSLSMPSSPSTPGTPTNMSPTAAKRDNVWRSVFNPGSNSATRNVGSDYFDKPQPNSPTVYDWYILYYILSQSRVLPHFNFFVSQKTRRHL